MLSTATIHRIADELLDEARRSPFGYTDPSGVPVPAMYRCDDLERLPQGLQSDIVRKAHRAASGSPGFFLLALAVLAAVVLLIEAAPAVFGTTLPYPALLAVAPLMPLFQIALTRRAVRRIAARVAAAWPVPSLP